MEGSAKPVGGRRLWYTIALFGVGGFAGDDGDAWGSMNSRDRDECLGHVEDGYFVIYGFLSADDLILVGNMKYGQSYKDISHP